MSDLPLKREDRMDPLSTAVSGMMAAQTRLGASASRVAKMGVDDSVDPAEEAVTQVQAKQSFAANAAVVKLSDEMWRMLLDVQEHAVQRV
jgi:flagellar hook protein FlgE